MPARIAAGQEKESTCSGKRRRHGEADRRCGGRSGVAEIQIGVAQNPIAVGEIRSSIAGVRASIAGIRPLIAEGDFSIAGTFCSIVENLFSIGEMVHGVLGALCSGFWTLGPPRLAPGWTSQSLRHEGPVGMRRR